MTPAKKTRVTTNTKLSERARKNPKARNTAPAAIIPWGRLRSTQITATTADRDPRAPAATSRPYFAGVGSSRSEGISAPKVAVDPALRSRAATTSRSPSLRSGAKMEKDTPAIITIKLSGGFAQIISGTDLTRPSSGRGLRSSPEPHLREE